MKKVIFLLITIAQMFFVSTAAYAQSAGQKLVGIYQGAPGTLPVILANGTKTWVTGFPGNPNPVFNDNPYGVPGSYDTAGAKYINWSLDKMAEIGIDFIIFDESNGIHLTAGNGQKVLEAGLLKYMDIVDERISRGVPTPKVTLMTPIIGIGNSCVEQVGGCLIGEADWIWTYFVNKNGSPRPGWFWLNGKPFLGIYSVRTFTPTFTDNRYTIRQFCNAGANECHQAQKNLGNVWFWTTRFENGPLYSPNSEEVTIQNGFNNEIACIIFGFKDKDPACYVHEGFTPQYYSDQWNAAIKFNPQIIVITSFGGAEGLEGGQIEQRFDFSPPTVYEDMTKEKVRAWKGYRLGDLNGDGKVDILDYNLIIQNFGKSYTIFDYNNLVTNYRK